MSKRGLLHIAAGAAPIEISSRMTGVRCSSPVDQIARLEQERSEQEIATHANDSTDGSLGHHEAILCKVVLGMLVQAVHAWDGCVDILADLLQLPPCSAATSCTV